MNKIDGIIIGMVIIILILVFLIAIIMIRYNDYKDCCKDLSECKTTLKILGPIRMGIAQNHNSLPLPDPSNLNAHIQ